MEQNQDDDEGGSENAYSNIKKEKSDSYRFDCAGVLHQSDMSLAFTDVQFVDDLVDPFLDQLKVLRTHALRAIDQKHNVCCGVATSW